MKIKARNKAKPEFSIASMTDLVFLLMIYFLLTSTIIAPNVMKVNLPSATVEQQTNSNAIEVGLSADMQYYVGPNIVSFADLESRIKEEITRQNNTEYPPTVVLSIDKTVQFNYAVELMEICNNIPTRLVIKALPKK